MPLPLRPERYAVVPGDNLQEHQSKGGNAVNENRQAIKQDRLVKAEKLLQQAVIKDFYGKITFTLERGDIVNIKEEKSIKW